MKFSLFFEMQIADPTPEKEQQLFRDCVQQAILADQVGYDRLWVVEHHGMYEYSHSSAPEVFLAYVAAVTKQIRLGHGVTQTPKNYNHPIRIAERIATLDILSGGRVDWGSGKSGSLTEQGAFQVNRNQLHDEWAEALDMIIQMWKKDVFEWNGKFYQIPPTQVVPKPIQTPHPPLFAACSTIETVLKVADYGMGVLNFAQGNDEFLKKKVSMYRSHFENSGEKPYIKNNHFAVTPTALILDDDQKACEYGFRGSRFFGESLAAYYFKNERPIGPLKVNRNSLTEDELAAAKNLRNNAKSPLLSVIGDPIAAKESISRFQSAGVDEVILVMQIGTVPQSLIMESIMNFAEKVMPAFK